MLQFILFLVQEGPVLPVEVGDIFSGPLNEAFALFAGTVAVIVGGYFGFLVVHKAMRWGSIALDDGEHFDSVVRNDPRFKDRDGNVIVQDDPRFIRVRNG